MKDQSQHSKPDQNQQRGQGHEHQEEHKPEHPPHPETGRPVPPHRSHAQTVVQN